MPKVLKKYVILLIIMIGLIIGSLNLGPLTSQTNASYKTIINGDSNATVAKWSITALDKDGTDVSMLGEGFKLEDTDSQGKWLFEIANNSDVMAIIDKNSKIRIRLDSDNFKTNDIATLSWNFLYSDNTSITNPIIFEVYMYDGSLNEILTYQKDSTIISYNDYIALTDKTGYIENISSTINKEKVFSTSDIVSFKKGIDDGLTQDIYFYYDFNLSHLSDQLFDLGFDKTKTFLIEWKINSGGSSGDISVDDATYYAYYKQYDNTGLMDPFEVTLNGIKYYVGYKLLKNYEYFNYICKTGYSDEPSFVFPSSIQGSTIKIRYSDLSEEQINLVTTTYPINLNEVSTEDDVRKYIERKNYEQYTIFKDNQDAFIKSLGYLDYGLSCKIIFDVKVDQVD